ncbi:MAG: hypothetical protein V4732_18825 [Pseudomonadota bacterium]
MSKLPSSVFTFFFAGRVGFFLPIYILVGGFEIYCILNTNSHGELNSYGWIGGLLALVVAAPWYWIFLYAHFHLGLQNLDGYIIYEVGSSVVLNAWLIYKIPYWFGDNDFPPVVIGNDEDFVDLSLKIVSFTKVESGANEFLVHGTLNNSKVGFCIELLPEWKEQNVEGFNKAFYWGNARFKSIGTETNNFILSLAKLYNVKIDSGVNEVSEAEVVGLACNPNEVETTPSKMKFIFNSEANEDLYSEVFININMNRRILEFNEKDNKYRAPLLQSLLKQL